MRLWANKKSRRPSGETPALGMSDPGLLVFGWLGLAIEAVGGVLGGDSGLRLGHAGLALTLFAAGVFFARLLHAALRGDFDGH